MTEEIKITKSSGCVFRDIGVPCPTPDEIRRATLLEIAGLARKEAESYDGYPLATAGVAITALNMFAQELERMAGE